jgi:hypothetical protein
LNAARDHASLPFAILCESFANPYGFDAGCLEQCRGTRFNGFYLLLYAACAFGAEQDNTLAAGAGNMPNEKSPAFINEEIAPSKDLSSASALSFSCGPVGRMRESAFMFNSCAADAVKSMFAPFDSRFFE